LIPKPRFTPTSGLPILAIFDDRSFLECLHRSSWCIPHAHRISSALIQHRYRNILQSPFPSHPTQAIPRIISRRYPRSIPPSLSHQSWRTNQETLPYGIDPKGRSAREALPFSNISQRQLKVSLICRRGTVLAGSPWRPPTTFQILCMTFPFSAAPRILGLTSNSSFRRFQYTFLNPSGLRFYLAI
jgi:hypothetical protein